jgi:hypothetical protein
MPDTPVEPAGSGRYPSDMESRVAVLEQIARATVASLDRFERRLDAMEGRFDGRLVAIEGRFASIEGRFVGIDGRIDALAAQHRTDFRWLIGIMLGGFGAMLGVMARGFHWL